MIGLVAMFGAKKYFCFCVSTYICWKPLFRKRKSWNTTGKVTTEYVWKCLEKPLEFLYVFNKLEFKNFYCEISGILDTYGNNYSKPWNIIWLNLFHIFPNNIEIYHLRIWHPVPAANIIRIKQLLITNHLGDQFR